MHDLPEIIGGAGIEYRLWDGWESRSRSSGGLDACWAVFCHHTASTNEPDDDCRWEWNNSDDRPIGNMLLDRGGRVTIGAAGAANTQGKGGPWTLSLGTIGLDEGNRYGIAIEAANAGTGEAWADAQQEAYRRLVAALCEAYGLDPRRDVLSHWEWVLPSCPGRKIDPAGNSDYATGAASWDMDRFRADVATVAPTPEPEPEPPEEDDDVTRLYLAKLDSNPNHVRRGDGNVAVIIRSNEVNALKSRMDRGDTGRSGSQCYYSPLDDSAIRTWAEIPLCNESQLDLDVGYIVNTSQASADEG